MNIQLRKMTTGDLDRVVVIQKAILRGPVGDAWRQMIAKHVADPDYVGFVAEDQGQVVGFIIGRMDVGGFGVEMGGWIEGIGVAPDHMGAGAGKALAGKVIEHFEASGVKDIFTSVRWDSGDLLAFFKNLGFDRSPFINLQRRG